MARLHARTLLAFATLLLGGCDLLSSTTASEALPVSEVYLAGHDGRSVTLDVTGIYPDTCGRFDRFDRARDGEGYIVQIKAIATGTSCGDALTPIRGVLTLTVPEAGTYPVRFTWQRGTQPADTLTVTLTVPADGPATLQHRLYVEDTTVPCTGEAAQACLLTTMQSEGLYSYFYDTIDGFTFEPGFRYVLAVEQRHVPDPPADGSSIAWRLLEIIERTATR